MTNCSFPCLHAGVVAFAGGSEARRQHDGTGAPPASAEPPPPWKEAFDKAKEASRTEAECLADAAALSIIRRRYGETAERIISMLLTFDALFQFREVMRARFNSEDAYVRKERALAFAQAHRTFWEQLERVTLGQHKSQYPHVVQLKAVGQMLELGDLWCFSLSALESFHAEVGRVADRTGCKRINCDAEGGPGTATTVPVSKKAKDVKEGPAMRIDVKASATMASSVANRLVAAKNLANDADLLIPMRAQSRIALAPSHGGGRATAVRTAPKLSALGVDKSATCVAEFAKLIAS
eukprot:3760111-Pleurochrysis_carterae.AAC.3